MKTISKLFLLTTTLFFMVSCSLSEEITFNTDGSLKYSYMLDASEMLKMMPDSANDQSEAAKDSIFSFAELIEKNKDSISKLPLEEQKKLESLKAFMVKIHENMGGKEYTIELMGNFKNTDALSTALSNLSTFNPEKKKKEEKSEPKMNFLTNTKYSWNGKVFKRQYNPVNKEEKDSAQDISNMFSGGTFKVKYNFPKKIKKISNSNAMFSSDGKTAVIEYNASEYLTTPEISDIEIEIEK